MDIIQKFTRKTNSDVKLNLPRKVHSVIAIARVWGEESEAAAHIGILIKYKQIFIHVQLPDVQICAFPKIVCIPSTFVHNNVFYWHDFYSDLFVLLALAQNLFSRAYLHSENLDSKRQAGRNAGGGGGEELSRKMLQTCLSNSRRHVPNKLEFLHCLSYILKHIKFCAILMEYILCRNN